MGEILIAGMASMLICIFLGPKFIEYLRVREFGQHIREDGPQEHHAKAGTPTMGGLIIFASICVPFLVLSDRDASALAVFGVALGCAALGFADDYIKIIKRRSLGLSGRYKLLGQLVLSLFLWWVARHSVGLEPRLYIRIGGGSIYLGPVLYFVLVFLVIAGTSNGVNLTDGLDGLAAGSCAIVLLTYTAIAFVANGQPDLALLGCCLVGACIGFLWYNAFPASIFMGDTGSLRPRRRDRRDGGDDPDRDPPDHHRRHLRDRGPLGPPPGLLLPHLPPPHLPDGPAPPPLRDDGLVGDEDHAPLLDHRRRLLGHRLHAVPALDRALGTRARHPPQPLRGRGPRSWRPGGQGTKGTRGAVSAAALAGCGRRREGGAVGSVGTFGA